MTRTYLDPKTNIRHAVRDHKPLIGGGYSIWTWCGWHTAINNPPSRAKARPNCFECVDKEKPDA